MIQKIDFNMNHDVVIFPSERGWKRIISDLMEAYQLDEEEAKKRAKIRTTEDNGYKEQLWEIIALHHDMFFNGTNYFETTKMILYNEKY